MFFKKKRLEYTQSYYIKKARTGNYQKSTARSKDG